MGKESSLSNADIMKIQGGVNLVQFAPYKEKAQHGKDEEGEPTNDAGKA